MSQEQVDAVRRFFRTVIQRIGGVNQEYLAHGSDESAWSVLEQLSDHQRDDLLHAMGMIERLFTQSLVELREEDSISAAAEYCLSSYFAELGERFEGGFDVQLDSGAGFEELVAPRGLLLVAYLREVPMGCGALTFHGGDPPEVKRLWVTSSARGRGIGRRLLRELEERVVDRGFTTLRLDTNRVLDEAIRLYRASGYVEVAPFNQNPYAHHWFEKALTAPVTRTS